jgi:hypothetical protein
MIIAHTTLNVGPIAIASRSLSTTVAEFGVRVFASEPFDTFGRVVGNEVDAAFAAIDLILDVLDDATCPETLADFEALNNLLLAIVETGVNTR